ncbi:MAG: PilZ domain-containing protein [Thermodesulfobacteriota bacterium]|nr:PilZ domain-containing protein [Thermodesulfobacteriota bacterium]
MPKTDCEDYKKKQQEKINQRTMDMDSLRITLHSGIIFITCLHGVFLFFIFFIYRARRHRKIREYALVEQTTVKKGERRRDQRGDLKLPVTMETTRGKFKTETLNLNNSGAFIICPNPSSLEDPFRLSIGIPDHHTLTMNAQVVWSNTHVPDDKVINRGVGVRFIQVSDENRRLLDHYISGSTN